MPRQSPTNHASNGNVGDIELSNNDNTYYIIALRKNKTKYWKSTMIINRQITKKFSSSAIHNISITEPYRFSGSSLFSINLSVNDLFFNVLEKKPQYINTNYGNAYIFGKYFKNGWVYAGTHMNDFAQTSIISTNNFNKDDIKNFENEAAWDKILKIKKRDDRKHLKSIQKIISDKIIFLGETYGRDTLIDVYIHYDIKNDIDSLIIDNNCIFSMLLTPLKNNKYKIFNYRDIIQSL